MPCPDLPKPEEKCRLQRLPWLWVVRDTSKSPRLDALTSRHLFAAFQYPEKRTRLDGTSWLTSCYHRWAEELPIGSPGRGTEWSRRPYQGMPRYPPKIARTIGKPWKWFGAKDHRELRECSGQRRTLWGDYIYIRGKLASEESKLVSAEEKLCKTEAALVTLERDLMTAQVRVDRNECSVLNLTELLDQAVNEQRSSAAPNINKDEQMARQIKELATLQENSNALTKELETAHQQFQQQTKRLEEVEAGIKELERKNADLSKQSWDQSCMTQSRIIWRKLGRANTKKTIQAQYRLETMRVSTTSGQDQGDNEADQECFEMRIRSFNGRKNVNGNLLSFRRWFRRYRLVTIPCWSYPTGPDFLRTQTTVRTNSTELDRWFLEHLQHSAALREKS